MTETLRPYPRSVDCRGMQVEIARMASSDREGLVALVASLSAHDLLFVRRDLSQPKVIDAWIRGLEAGTITSLVARDGDRLIGCTAIVCDALSWSRHVGEVRVLVSASVRGHGVGRVLMQECFIQALKLGLKKIVAQMTTDQVAAIAVFEEMGFRPEALLAKHVMDRGGAFHDIVLLSHDVDAVARRNDAYGLQDALA